MRTTTRLGLAALAAATAASAVIAPAYAAPIPTSQLVDQQNIVVTGPGGLHYFSPIKADLIKAHKVKSGTATYASPLLRSATGKVSKDTAGVIVVTRVKQGDLTDAQRDSELGGMLKSISEEITAQTGSGKGDLGADALYATRSLFNIQAGLINYARANNGPEPINHVAYTPGELISSVTRWVKALPEDKAKQAYSRVDGIYTALIDRGNGADSWRQGKVNWDTTTAQAGVDLTAAISNATGAGFTAPADKKPVLVAPVTRIDGVEYINDAVYLNSDALTK